MFILSKLFWIVCQPLSLAFLLGAFGFLAGLLRRRGLSLVAVGLSGVILFVALFTTTGSYMVQTLEDRFPRPAAGDPADLSCMIVLGGGFDNHSDTYRGGYNMNGAGDRFIETLRLARKYPQAKILVSGGDGTITQNELGDAVIAQRMFADFGIAKDRTLDDGDSRTTFENAINTKQLLAANGLSHCLLITSGFHMPRSVGIFRKLDIDVIPWVVDYRSSGQEYPGLDFTQPQQNAGLLSTAVREWIGMVAYYALGRTSALYPGP